MVQNRKKICKTLSILFMAVLLLLSVLAFFFYSDLKKTFTGRISEKVTFAIDQQVEIGDISLSIASGINIENIRIRNPEGFPPGQLLGIEKVVLFPDYRELLKGRLYFSSISLHSPALTIFENDDGRMNISDELRRRLSEKGTAEYRIDELNIKSGVAAFNDDLRYTANRVNLLVQNLSSVHGTKTSLKGDLYWAGDNNVRLDGWANLQDEPMQFSLAVSAGEIRLSAFSETLMKYRIDPEKTVIKLVFDLGGNTEQGVSIRSGIEVRSPGHEFYRKGPIEVAFDTDAFYDISDRTITVDNFSISSGGESAISVRGKIRNIPERPDYDLSVRIGRLDLSDFNIFQGFSASGILSSDLIKVKGGMGRMPGLDGYVQLKEGSLKSAGLELRNTSGKIIFIPGQVPAALAEFNSDILTAGGYPFSGSAPVEVSVHAKQLQQGLAISSTLAGSPVAIKTSEKTVLSMKDLHMEFVGKLRENLLSGTSAVNAREILYDGSYFERLKAGFDFSYNGGDIKVKNPRIDTEVFSSSADTIELDARTKGEFSIEAKNVSAVHPALNVSLDGADVSAIVHTEKEISGSISFMAGSAGFGEFKSGRISGRAKYNPRGFTLDIPDANFSGGKVMIAAEGRTSKGPFPVKLKMTAENLDLGAVLPAGEEYLAGYRLSGDLKRSSFEGTLVSKESINGKMELELQKFTLLNEKTNLHIFRDLSVSPVITLNGKDSDFRADVSAGDIIVRVSGTARNFLSEERELQFRGELKETPLNEIRTVLWDSFPDRLLYAGLEGSVNSEITIRYNRNRTAVDGNMSLKNVTIEGENGEYLVGPANGTIPFAYGKFDERKAATSLPSFDKSDFEKTSRHYAETAPGNDFNRISIGNIRYGFRLLTDLAVWMKQDGSVLNIDRFSGNIFGGKLNGSAVIDLTEGLQYRGGMILEEVSLTTLGRDIEPVKGYISGKLNGIGLIRGSEGGLSELIGRADFWTYATRDEKMRISREFLQKIGGPSIKPYLADRNFDRGIVSLYIQKGFFIFRELEISNRNIFGIQDLAVKVAPLSNRIAIDHLMWTIIEAAERAKQNGS